METFIQKRTESRCEVKIKKHIKDWRKWSNRAKRHLLSDLKDSVREYKNLMLALKFAKKALRHIKKDAECDCGFWSEHYCGHWHENCLALGRCTDNPANCPLELAKSLVKSLEVGNGK